MARFSFTFVVTVAALVVSTMAAPIVERGSSGQATYYDTSVGIGACGKQNKNSDHIVAINSAQYNGGSHCGKMVKITNKKTGKSIKAKVADECPTCAWGDLDLTPSTFSAIANQDDGVAPISWSFSG